MTSRWRTEARQLIAETVTSALEERPELRADLAALFVLVGKAYPFGARKHEPYRVWLDELRLARLQLEHEGDPLSRRCPSCGATPGRACRPRYGDDTDTLSAERDLAVQTAPRGRARQVARQVVHARRRVPRYPLDQGPTA